MTKSHGSWRMGVLLLLTAVGALACAYNCRVEEKLASTQPYREVPPNYTLVEPGLYVGGQVKAPPAEVRAVLCLSEYKDAYATPVHVWHPIPDSEPAPSLEWLREQVTFIDAQRQAGNAVFVHCDAGISRSGLVTAAYLMWRNHWRRAEALAFLRQTRPIIQPNAAFMVLLGEWEETLTQHN